MRRLLVTALVALVAIPVLWLSPAPAGAESTPLADLFAGRKLLVEDERFKVDRPDLFRDASGGVTHAETSTVDLGPGASPRYRMLYRTFVGPTGAKRDDGVPAGIGLATSADGHSWNVHNGGKPVLAGFRSAPKLATGCSTADCIHTFYAPSVSVDADGSLVMAFEQWDTGVWPDVDHPTTRPVFWIGFARSTDGGVSWTRLATDFVATRLWEGFDGTHHIGNVGTPDLRRDATGTWALSYHGFDGNLSRGLAAAATVDGLQSSERIETMTPTAGWSNGGVGRASDLLEAGYLYRVYEAFDGRPNCVQPDVAVGWGLARSADGGRTWESSPMAPIRVGRLEWSCGEDLPAWQVVAGESPMVVAAHIHFPAASEATVRRYRLVDNVNAATSSTSTVVATVTTSSGNGYWQLTAAGEVFAFGDARSLGSAPAGRNDFVAMAARAAGDGYWLLARTGEVFAFGSATKSGSGSAGATAIAARAAGGYWIGHADGRVAAFGGARALGSMTGMNGRSLVGLVTHPTKDGYWGVTNDGKVSAFGSGIKAYGSASGVTDVIGMAVRPDGSGYWLARRTGNILRFGTGTPDFGDTRGYQPKAHFAVSAIAPKATGGGAGTGTVLAAIDGGVIDLGAARYRGEVRAAGWTL